MRFRIATLNLEQDQKRWDMRRALIEAEIARLQPDLLALNEISIPRQTARGLQQSLRTPLRADYSLVQQSRANALSKREAEALLTRLPIVETGNLDFQTRDIVALVARLLVDRTPIDVYVT